MKKKILLACISVCIFAAIVLPFFINAVSSHAANSAAKRVDSLPPYDMVHVLVYGYDRDTVSARITLYSEDENTVCAIERSWNADALMLLFAEFSYGTKTFIFPYMITNSGSKSLSRGIYLPNYYLSQNKCHLLSARRSEADQKDYARIAKFATSRVLRLFSHSRSIQTVNLSQCIPGTEYEILFYQNGSVKVIPVAEDYLSLS